MERVDAFALTVLVMQNENEDKEDGNLIRAI